MDDFLSNDGKTEEFLRKMIALAEQEVGDRVTVTYTGELSVVDAFTGQVLSVEAAE